MTHLSYEGGSGRDFYFSDAFPKSKRSKSAGMTG